MPKNKFEENGFQKPLTLLRQLTAIDKELNPNPVKLFISTVEELGEFCRAYAVETNSFGKNHKKLDEPAAHEAVDMLICAYALQSFVCHQKGIPSAVQNLLGLWESESAAPWTDDYYVTKTVKTIADIGSYLSNPNVLSALTEELASQSMILYRISGGTLEELPEIMLKKLNKWKENQSN